MIVNGLAIGIPVALFFAGLAVVWVITGRDSGRHAADALTVPSPLELHHEEGVPGRVSPTPAGGADVEAGPGDPAVPAAPPPPGPGGRPGPGGTTTNVPAEPAAGGDHGAATHATEGASAAAPAPGPVSLPEGNTHTAAWPPQETAGPGEPTWWLTPTDHHAAEAWATRPWEDDTGTFTAICAEVAS